MAPARTTIAEVRQKEGPVLVVDDDEPFRTGIVETLQQAGYAVVSARDGREALEYLRGDNVPALVLLDMMIPLANGWSLLEAVQHDPRLASVPVVLTASLGDDSEVDDVRGPVRQKLLSLAATHCRRASASGLGSHA